MAKSKYKVKAMDELPSEEQLAMEKMEQASRKRLEESETSGIDETPVETADETVNEEVAKTKVVEKVVGFRSSRYKSAKARIDRSKVYPVKTAIELLKEMATAKFDETVEVHCVTKEILSAVELTYPHSTGKTIRVQIMNDETKALLDKGLTDFDVLLASPSQMKDLTKYARLLGPKGLMPNPKNGTLIADPEKRAKELAGGKTSVRGEKKAPLLHTSIGKISMETSALAENLSALINACGPSKILKVVLCTSMSPGIKVSL